jgi:hypothetical protein
VDVCAVAGGAVDGECSAECFEAVGEAAEAGGWCGGGAADAVVCDVGGELAVGGVDADVRAAGLGVLGDVGEGLRDGEVDRRFGAGRGAPARDAQLDGDGRARGELLERDGEAALAQRRRVDPAGEVAQFG